MTTKIITTSKALSGDTNNAVNAAGIAPIPVSYTHLDVYKRQSPNIMKYQIGLHPGIIIFSLIAGGAVFGWIGLLLAVPVVAIIQEILRYYLIEKKRPTSR